MFLFFFFFLKYGFFGLEYTIIFHLCPAYSLIRAPMGKTPGPDCSKLMTSLVNVSLKLLKVKAHAVQKLLSFFKKKISVYLVIKL